MTEDWIQQQIIVIKEATKKALVSKEASIKFLTDAGILRDEVKVKRKKKK